MSTEHAPITLPAFFGVSGLAPAMPGHAHRHDPFGAYGLTSVRTLELSPAQRRKELEENRKEGWNDTAWSRAERRLVTRGVVGAAAFTFGGWYASRGVGLKGYDMAFNPKLPLHWAAKGVDAFVGTPLKTVVNALGHDGEAFVRFRPTMNNRTLGEEAVGITFDFMCMGGADKAAQNAFDAFDPTVKKDWRRADGSIDYGKFSKAFLKEGAHILTYNMAEDAAVAIPYSYEMKFLRHLGNKFSPGFRYDFDRSLNGGSLKVSSQGVVNGSYALAGALNLQLRFMGYNGAFGYLGIPGTIHYREAYNHLAHIWKGEPTSLFGKPKTAEERAQEGIGEKISNVAKWMARGGIKSTIYMAPATPFFWITRTPQSKYKAAFINPEHDALLCYQHHGHDQAVRATELWRHHDGGVQFRTDTPVYFRQSSRRLGTSEIEWRTIGNSAHVLNPLRHGHFSPYEHTFGTFDRALNGVGRFNNTVQRKLHDAVPAIAETLHSGNLTGYTRLVNRYWNALVAYTPYIYAKSEFANLWDRGRMDIAAERTIDAAASLNWGEMRKGFHEMSHAFLRIPLPDPAREAYAHERRHGASDPGAARPYYEREGLPLPLLAPTSISRVPLKQGHFVSLASSEDSNTPHYAMPA